jgi:hypothetical protein
MLKAYLSEYFHLETEEIFFLELIESLASNLI